MKIIQWSRNKCKRSENFKCRYLDLWLSISSLNKKLPPDLRLRLTRNFENEVWTLDNMLEMLKLEVDAKEHSLTITSSNFNNNRTTFHQPDFTASALSNLAARK